LVNFIRVEKNQPSRRNKSSRLIFWNAEVTDQYQFQTYLEQNRYARLFKEIDILGEGGFGKVYKVQHNLDQRTYAIKKIQIHLGLNQDFKQHSVYREIGAISQVLHKNVVRYFACWIESIEPDHNSISKVVRKIEKRSRLRNLDDQLSQVSDTLKGS
jgi:serine/threonine protein kinase